MLLKVYHATSKQMLRTPDVKGIAVEKSDAKVVMQPNSKVYLYTGNSMESVSERSSDCICKRKCCFVKLKIAAL